MTLSIPPLSAARPAARQQAGFSLIEVLVAVIVLSFGLLGMVGMQAAALRTNRDARLQSSAITLARELAEMMRGNKAIAMLPTATNPYLMGKTTSPLTAPTPTYCLAVGSVCATPAVAALAEMTDWLARVDSELPGATVAVCRDMSPYDNTNNGVPQWTCTSASDQDEIVIKIGWNRPTLKAGNGTTDTSLPASDLLSSSPSIVLPVTPGDSL